ncbi:MAG: TonB-dependent receptor [Alistipes sp.]|nr:TonB-dependent receptor [Alistipes sp.]
MKKSIILLVALCLPIVAMAQRTLTGKITDVNNGQPLVGATLFWKNTTAGATSATDGSYSIKRVHDFNTLVVDYLGYDMVEIEVEEKGVSTLDIQLTPSAVDIDEVIVEGQQRGNYAKTTGITRQEQISFAGLCKMACCSLAESFENSASVTVGYSDAISGARQIKMLGLAGTYTQILDENRPIMQGAGATYGLSYTPGMWLNSIQVSKGVASVTAGHEAITGQINLEHRKPTDDERFFLNLYFDNEMRPEINISSAIPLTPDKSLSTVIMAHGSLDTAHHDMNNDGFADMPKSNQINIANKWLWQNRDGIQLRWGWKFVNENRVGGKMNYREDMFDQMMNNPLGCDTYGSKIHNQNFNAYTKLGIPVGYERTFTGDPEDAVQNNIAMVFDYDNYRTDSYFGVNNVDVMEDTFRFNATYAHYFTQRSSLNAGISAYARMMDNDYLQQNASSGTPVMMWEKKGKATLAEPGIFAEYTYNNEEKFSWVIGLRGDYSVVNGNYYYDAKPEFLITPRSHIRWAITPRTTLRASAGMGYRRQNLVTDNIWIMTSSRDINSDMLTDDMERAATFGGSIAQTFRLAGDDQTTISFDYFRTQFFNTLVFDQERGDNTTHIYNTDGKSYTDNYQVDFNWTPFRGFDLFATFRYTNAMMTLEQDGKKYLVERPLTSRYKGLINIQYAVQRWVFDVTAQINGPVRLPQLDGNMVVAQSGTNISPVYPMYFAQISYKMSNLTLYAGCENIANYLQGVSRGNKPIVGGDAPYAPGFNSSMVWGPLMGRKFYIGLRLNIY